jgi:hypothetical protein
MSFIPSLANVATGGILWKVGAIAGGVAAAALGVTALVQHFQIETLNKAINDPKTGYLTQVAVARQDAAQAHANAKTLSASLDVENARIEKISADDAKTISDLRGQVAAALKQVDARKAQVAQILNAPLTGRTTCDRYDEVDHRLLELEGLK